MSVALYKITRVNEDINRNINRALSAGIPVATIVSSLNGVATSLTAVTPAPTHDRTMKDTGAPLNPTQVRTIGGVPLYKQNRVVEDLNRYVNRWIGAGVPVAQIDTALTNAATALGAVVPPPTHGRMMKDLGPALNPTQPRNV